MLERKEIDRRASFSSEKPTSEARLSQMANTCIEEGRGFKLQTSQVLQQVCRTYIASQLEHAKRMQEIWEKALEEIAPAAPAAAKEPVSAVKHPEAGSDSSESDEKDETPA